MVAALAHCNMSKATKSSKLVWTKTAAGTWTQVPANQVTKLAPAPTYQAPAATSASVNSLLRAILAQHDHPATNLLKQALAA